VIFDSDILIWASRVDVAAQAIIDDESDRRASIMSLMELLRGARSKLESRLIRQFFVNLEIEIIPISETISYAAANLIEEHALSDGLRIEDALIAATAHETGQILATANIKHFRSIPRLQLKPFRPQRH
jgi:predicted nucleic acid-binding protein